MIEYSSSQHATPHPPTTPQRMVMMLSGKSDYSHLLPPPAISPNAAAASLMMKATTTTSTMPTLTPVQQTPQSPRRMKAVLPLSSAFSQHSPPPRLSAFTSPQQQQEQQQQLPTESALTDSELSFFTRVTDVSSSSLNCSSSTDHSFHLELRQTLRPVNKSFAPQSPQRITATGVQPKVGYGLMDEAGDAFSRMYNNSNEWNAVSEDVAGMVVPVKAPESPPIHGGGAAVAFVDQQRHLLEQHHEHSLLQQEPRFIQRQHEEQQYDDHKLLSQVEYQYSYGKDDVSVHQTTFEKYSTTAEDIHQTITEQIPNRRTYPVVQMVMTKSVDGSDVGTSEVSNEPLPDRSYVELTDDSNIFQRQVVERMMAMTPTQFQFNSNLIDRNRRSAVSSRTPRNRKTVTPRISNYSSGSESDAVSMKEHIINQYQIEKKWHVDTFNSVKTTMHRAVRKLRTLATHISNDTNDSLPEAVNTSTESSYANSGFDLMDLISELRNSKIESVSQLSAENYEGCRVLHQHSPSASSFDTLGAQKPATLTHSSFPLSNLEKPIALNPSKISPVLLSPFKVAPNSLNNTNELVLNPTTVSRIRAVTPIARMRNQGTDHMSLSEELFNRMLPDDDVKAVTQKNWKETTGTFKNNRERRVKNENDHVDKQKQRQPTKKAKMKDGKQEEPPFLFVAGQKCRIPTGFSTCRSDVVGIFEQFITTRCCIVDSTYETDDEEAESVDCYELRFYSDYESCSNSDTSTVDKQHEKAVFKPSINIPAGSHVTQKTLKHSITVDISDKQFIRQFITTATTEGIALLSHPMTFSEAFRRRPIKSTAILRRGMHFRSGNFIGPMLVWNDAKCTEGGEIDIFAIRSLEMATLMELKNYPYAVHERSIFLRLQNGLNYVFEAKDASDAFRFVHGMRWLLARLVFNHIIGNVSVCCELLDIGEETNVVDRYRMFSSSTNEEARWIMAMNEATTHFVAEVAKSID